MLYLTTFIAALVIHVLDDFGLQHFTHLNELKQKAWWTEQLKKYPALDARLYKHDYIVCLMLHAFKWTCLTMVPMLIAFGLPSAWTLALLVIFSTATHAFIDDLKANKLKISLLQDQAMHVLQLIVSIAVLA